MMKKKHIQAIGFWTGGESAVVIDPDAANQALWDEIISLTPWVISPIENSNGDGGASIDNDGTFALVSSDGDNVKSFKGMGHTLPNRPNLFPAVFWLTSEGYNVWYSHEGDYPRYRDRGGFDKSVRFRNGLRNSFQTGDAPLGAGGLTPTIGAPYHEFLIWRAFPGPVQETNNFWKWTGLIMEYTQANPDVDGGGGNTVDYFRNEYWEYVIDAAGNWQVLKNGLVANSGTGGAMTAYGEFRVGAVGHSMEFDFRASLINQNGDWTSAELTTIRDNIETIWGNDYPEFPYYRNIAELGSRQQNAGSWDMLRDEQEAGNVKIVDFNGGSGIEGDSIYRWFYMADGDNDTFPLNNKLDEHLPFTQGRVILDSGASGSVDGITVDGVEIMSSSVNFDTDLETTASLVCDNINNNSATGHRAYSGNGGIIYIVYGDNDFLEGGELIVSSTTTIAASDINVSNNGGGTEADGGHLLVRSDYEAGNAEGFPVIFLNPGTSPFIRLICIIEPIDNLGVRGEYISSQWTLDNIS